MAEEKKFWHEVKVGVTVAGICGAGALLWKLLVDGWASIIQFFLEDRYLPTWAFFLIGFALVALFLWGLFYKLELEWDRTAYVPISLLSEIQKKGKFNDLRKGRIRVQDGKVYYCDLWRRNKLVEEFKDFKPPEHPPLMAKLPNLRYRK